MLCASIIIRIHIFISQIVCMVFVIRLTKKYQDTGADQYYLMFISSYIRIFSVTSINIFFILNLIRRSFLYIRTCNHTGVCDFCFPTILDIGQHSSCWTHKCFRIRNCSSLYFRRNPTIHLPRFARRSRSRSCRRHCFCYYFHNHFCTYF